MRSPYLLWPPPHSDTRWLQRDRQRCHSLMRTLCAFLSVTTKRPSAEASSCRCPLPRRHPADDG